MDLMQFRERLRGHAEAWHSTYHELLQLQRQMHELVYEWNRVAPEGLGLDPRIMVSRETEINDG